MSQFTDIKMVKLKGTPRQRGRIHGEEFRALIWELLERLKYGLPGHLPYPGMSSATMIERFLADTKHVAAAEKWAPQLLEEVRGIGEGAGIGFEEAFFLSSINEFARHGQSLMGIQSQCTSLGCSRDGDTPAMMGQNIDTTIHYRNLVVLLHIIEPDGREKYVLTLAGGVGLFGLNDAPLGVCLNSVGLKSSRDGLPLCFLTRCMLEKDSVDEAVAFMQSVRIGCSQNLMIGDKERVVDYEVSANAAVRFEPYKGAKRVYHSNHHLVNDDIIPLFPAIEQHSLSRFNYLKFRLDDPDKPVASENLKGILRSHLGPICIHGDHAPTGLANTLASVVYVMSEQPEFHVVLGNPCEAAYRKFTFGR